MNIPLVSKYINKRAAEIANSRNITEATKYDDDFGWKVLDAGGRGAGAFSDLPQVFTDMVLRESHWLYDSHGLAFRIIERAKSIMYEAGFSYKAEFLDGVPEVYRAQIMKRLDEFWYSDESDIQTRTNGTLTELLLSGEHGWRTQVNSVTGRVRIGDFNRKDVKELYVDSFDKSQLSAVTLIGEVAGADEDLAVISTVHDPKDAMHGALKGECIYFRLGQRPSKKRGRPLLQPAIDELKAEKRFRTRSSDRALTRLAVFLDTTVDVQENEIEAYKQKYGTALPQSGGRLFHTPSMKNEFISANLDAAEIVNFIRSNITVIAGIFGMPISWFGFGDGSTKATSETQQEPAERDMKVLKTQFIAGLERLLYFVVDQMLAASYMDASAVPNMGIMVETEPGTQKRLRDCVTITVSPIPLSKEQRDAMPLAATTAAIKIISDAELLAKSSGKRVFTDEQIASMLTTALNKDGIEFEIDAIEDAALPALDQAAA